MKVEKAKFYHIHKSNRWDHLWTLNSKLSFEKGKKNEFNEYYEHSNLSFRIGDQICAPMYANNKMLELSNQLHLQDFINYLLFNYEVLKDCGMYIREQIFESIRVEIDNNLPSRLSCIWLIDSKSLNFWYNRLGNSGDICLMEVTGNLHKCDQIHLYNEIKEHSKLREDARKYWSGVISNQEQEEILFEGDAKIIAIYKSISDIEII